MTLSLKLSHKGLILVAVPLIFELVFIAVLNDMLQQSEREAERAQHAHEVVTHINNVLRLLMDSGRGVVVFVLTGESKHLTYYKNSYDVIPAEISVLEKLTRDNPSQYQDTLRIKNLIGSLHERLGSIRHLLKHASREEIETSLDSVKTMLNEVQSQASLIVEVEQKIESDFPKIQAEQRMKVKNLLTAGVIFNILLAVSLAVIFNRGTARRLAILMENTGRFAKGGELLPPLKGNDEIARLDRIFNDMVKTLKEAEKERLEVERMKQEFISMVSHDLRSPLNSVLAFLNMLPEGVYGELSELGVNKANVANRNITRLIGLINDLLDAEKLESGKLTMNFTTIDLADILERSVESMRGLAEKEEVIIELPPVDMQIEADGDRLMQVVINLLSNAIKFSPKGGRIKLTATAAGDRVAVKVQDEGRGIAPRYQKMIFERFQQVTTSDGTEKGGSGLGLAICKAIVEQHGGIIGVDSQEGKGSTFWFKIPLSQHKKTDAPAEAAPVG